MRSLRTWRWVVALTVAVLLYYWKLFFPAQYTFLTGVEETYQAFSWLNFWVRSLHQGTLPLWDSYAYAGYLFPGEMQTSAFNPVFLIALLFPLTRDGMLSIMDYHVLFLLGHLMAAWFMFALIRELGLNYAAAFVAGLCFSVGGTVGRTIWLDMIQSAAWLPLIFLFLLRALKQNDDRRFILNGALSGLCVGLSVLGGRLHMTIAQGIFVVAGLIYYASQQARSTADEPLLKRRWMRAFVLIGVISLVGVLSGAIQLLPSQVYGAHSFRFYGAEAFPSTQRPPYFYTSQTALSPAGVLSFIFPSFEVIGQGEIWPPYIGILPLLFAVIAIVRCWSNVWVRFLVGISVVAILYSLSRSSALQGISYAVVPLIWIVREATRFLYLTAFALAVLAAFGLDLVFETSRAQLWTVFRKVLFWGVAGSSLALFIPLMWPKAGDYWLQFSCLMILLSSALLWHILVRRAEPTRGMAVLAILLIFFDLSGFNWNIGDKLAADKAGTDQYEILTSMRGVVRFLRQRPHFPQPFRVHVFKDPRPNIGDSYGVEADAGMGATLATDFLHLVGDVDLLNVRYFIKPASATDASPVYSDADWKVFENSNAFPRAWLAHQVRVQPDEQALNRERRLRQVDLRQCVLLSAPLANFNGSQASSGETANVTSYAAHSFEIAVHAATPALLVASEIYWPEWHATVNGHETTVLRADGALRAVVVPAGDSVVRFVYRPWSFYIGAALSLATFTATLLFALAERRRLKPAARSKVMAACELSS